MCDWGTDVVLNVPVSAKVSRTGKFRWTNKAVDSCIAKYVQALNDAGLYTDGSCCGHGEYNGYIGLHDGTMLTISKIDTDMIVCGIKEADN